MAELESLWPLHGVRGLPGEDLRSTWSVHPCKLHTLTKIGVFNLSKTAWHSWWMVPWCRWEVWLQTGESPAPGHITDHPFGFVPVSDARLQYSTLSPRLLLTPPTPTLNLETWEASLPRVYAERINWCDILGNHIITHHSLKQMITANRT